MLVYLLLFIHCLAQGRSQLVGAGRVLVPAADALKLANDILGFHATHECGNALQVAMTAAIELHIAQDALFIDVKIDLGRACALGIISIFHSKLILN